MPGPRFQGFMLCRLGRSRTAPFVLALPCMRGGRGSLRTSSNAEKFRSARSYTLFPLPPENPRALEGLKGQKLRRLFRSFFERPATSQPYGTSPSGSCCSNGELRTPQVVSCKTTRQPEAHHLKQLSTIKIHVVDEAAIQISVYMHIHIHIYVYKLQVWDERDYAAAPVSPLAPVLPSASIAAPWLMAGRAGAVLAARRRGAGYGRGRGRTA